MTDLYTYRSMLVAAGKQMSDSGLTVETWGNISLRDPESGLVFLTPSAMAYDRITPEDIVVCDLAGNIVEGTRKPTVEKELHLSIYRRRSEINAIIHTHPIYSLIFGVLHEEIPPIIDEAAQILKGTIRVAPYALAGSPQLAENCVNTLGDESLAVMLANHGSVCVGKDLTEAFRVAKVLEMTAEVYFKARSLGTPVAISDGDLFAMKDMMKAYYAANK